MNTQAVNDNHVIIKAYVDQSHNDNEGDKRDLGLNFYNESSGLLKNKGKDFNDNKLRTPTTDYDSAKKYWWHKTWWKNFKI